MYNARPRDDQYNNGYSENRGRQQSYSQNGYSDRVPAVKSEPQSSNYSNGGYSNDSYSRQNDPVQSSYQRARSPPPRDTSSGYRGPPAGLASFSQNSSYNRDPPSQPRYNKRELSPIRRPTPPREYRDPPKRREPSRDQEYHFRPPPPRQDSYRAPPREESYHSRPPPPREESYRPPPPREDPYKPPAAKYERQEDYRAPRRDPPRQDSYDKRRSRDDEYHFRPPPPRTEGSGGRRESTSREPAVKSDVISKEFREEVIANYEASALEAVEKFVAVTKCLSKNQAIKTFNVYVDKYLIITSKEPEKPPEKSTDSPPKSIRDAVDEKPADKGWDEIKEAMPIIARKPSEADLAALEYLTIKGRRCFICEDDNFDDEDVEIIKKHLSTHRSQFKKELVAICFCGCEFIVTDKCKALKRHWVSCETCIANVSVAVKMKQTSLISQVARIRKKIGFCPIQLTADETQVITEKNVPDDIVDEFLKGGKNGKPFRTVGTILYNSISPDNPDKLLRAVLFSETVRFHCKWDHLLDMSLEDALKPNSEGQDHPDTIKLRALLSGKNASGRSINKFKYVPDGSEFDSCREFVAHILQTVST